MTYKLPKSLEKLRDKYIRENLSEKVSGTPATYFVDGFSACFNSPEIQGLVEALKSFFVYFNPDTDEECVALNGYGKEHAHNIFIEKAREALKPLLEDE